MILNIRTSDQIVALTFDDGPDPIYTRQILDTLDRNRVKATFFMIGKAVEKHPETARAVFENGHEIGNHSYSHPRMVLRSPRFVRSQIERTDAALRNLGVTGAIHFRSPFGARLIILTYVLMRKKKQNILCDVDSRDWQTQDPQLVTQRVLRDTKAGSIIMLHDGGGERAGTVQATETIIAELKRRGFRFLKVSELLAQAKSGRALLWAVR